MLILLTSSLLSVWKAIKITAKLGQITAKSFDDSRITRVTYFWHGVTNASFPLVFQPVKNNNKNPTLIFVKKQSKVSKKVMHQSSNPSNSWGYRCFTIKTINCSCVLSCTKPWTVSQYKNKVFFQKHNPSLCIPSTFSITFHIPVGYNTLKYFPRVQNDNLFGFGELSYVPFPQFQGSIQEITKGV